MERDPHAGNLRLRPGTVAGRMKAGIPLSGRLITCWLLVATLVATCLQLGFGASPFVVLLAATTATLGVLFFAAFGPMNTGAWVALFYVLSNVLVALCAKTLMGQSLGSHLYAALSSFLVLLITTVGLVTALLLAKVLPVGRPLFRPTSNGWILAWLSWGSFSLGILFWLANQHFQGPYGSGFGGLAVFHGLLYMAVIARTATLLERSRDRRSFDVVLGVIIGAAVFLGLLSDRKADAAYPVVAYFATVFFYRRRLYWKQMLTIVIGAALFVLVLAPLIHVWRGLGQEKMSLSQRVAVVADTAGEIVKTGRLDHYLKKPGASIRGGYYNYFGGNGNGQRVLGRFASIQQVDPVVAETEHQGTLGGSAIWPAFARLTPSFILPNKPKFIEGYHILVRFGLINPRGGKFPTVPLAGQAYAAYGLVGVLTIPFCTFLVFLLLLKKLGWHLYRNVYAIFFFVNFVIVYVAQGSFGQYAGAVLRNFPLFAITFYLFAILARVTMRAARRPLARANGVGDVT